MSDPTRPAAQLHPRNRHQQRYDFPALCASSPELVAFMRLTPKGNRAIDFTDPQAIKALNRALLKHWYGIEGWDIPDGYLCPPIPGRADYIHHLADLLASSHHGVLPRGEQIQVLDIGCGANCIYPLIGHSEYQWQFSGADIEPASLASAQKILDANPALAAHIHLQHQPDPQCCFSQIIQPNDRYDLTLCNPPFHSSPEQMNKGNQRKWKHPGKWDGSALDSRLNFGGQSNELWCDGGEEAFISRMIRESVQFGAQVYWFTCLVSKQTTLTAIEPVLQEVAIQQRQTLNMTQGLKTSRFIAWSFLTPAQRQHWQQQRWD